jgi:hypothetical protein
MRRPAGSSCSRFENHSVCRGSLSLSRADGLHPAYVVHALISERGERADQQGNRQQRA